MEPVTQFVVGTGIVWLLDKLREQYVQGKAQVATSSLPEPIRFSEQQINHFTRVDGPIRVFDKDVSGITLAILSARSLTPVSDRTLSFAGQQAWMVVPLTAGLPKATEIIQQAFATPGAVVLGSLSLVLLPNGSAAPMMIVVGGTASKMLAQKADPQQGQPGGVFAELRAPEQAKVEAPASVSEEKIEVPAQVVGGDFPATVDALAAELQGSPAPSKKNGKRNGSASKPEPEIVEAPVTPEREA